MTDAREDNEIVGEAPDAKFLEPEDSDDGYIVNMERESAFRPDAPPAVSGPRRTNTAKRCWIRRPARRWRISVNSWRKNTSAPWRT